MKNDNASKVTKVLIQKLHGGRKLDSKFWQSEFSEDSEKELSSKNPKDYSANILSFLLYPIIGLAIFITAYAGYYGYKEYFQKPINAFPIIAVPAPRSALAPAQSKPKYSQSKHNRQTDSRTSEDKLVTKKELDRAIQKALNKQSTPRKTNSNRSISREPYYRVELTSGSVIRAKSAVKDGTHYTIKDIQGLEFSMLRSDIKNVQKIFPEY